MITDYMHELHCAVSDSNVLSDADLSSFSDEFFSLFEEKNLKSDKAKKALQYAHDKLIAKIKSGVNSAVKDDFTFLKYGCYFILNDLSAFLGETKKSYSLESKIDFLVSEAIRKILIKNADSLRILQIYNLIDTRVDSDFMSVFGLINSNETSFNYSEVSNLRYDSVFATLLLAITKPEHKSALDCYLTENIDPKKLLKNQSEYSAYFSLFEKLFPKSKASAIFYSVAFIFFKDKVSNWLIPLEAKLESCGRN